MNLNFNQANTRMESSSLKFLPKFFDLLREHKIHYCVLRNFHGLPNSMNGSDLDICVVKKDLSKFYTILFDCMQSNGMSLVSAIFNAESPKFCISNNKWGVQIDVFISNVFYNGKEIFSKDILWKNVEDFNGIKVLNSRAGSLLAFLKELLNNKTCSSKYIKDLRDSFKEHSSMEVFLQNFSKEFIFDLKNFLINGNDEKVNALYKQCTKSFPMYHVAALPGKLKRLFLNPGFTVVFLGTDGAGKSTIIDIIQPVLKGAFHNGVYYEHFRPNLLPSLGNLISRKKKINSLNSDPHAETPSGSIISFFRWSYYLIDYIFGYGLKVLPKKSVRSCVWLFDRYYYDYLIDPRRARIKLPRYIIKVGQMLIPEPDIILCLGADAELIHNRKPELTLKEVDRQVKGLQSFCDRHKRAVWIDTGKSINHSSSEAIIQIIKMMATRFEKVKLK